MNTRIRISTILLLIIALALLSFQVYAQAGAVVPGKNIVEWNKLKYGMFIHFNMNTFAGAEYDDGKMPTGKFNPSHADVDQWIRTASNAGMKYAVLTVKHTGGFCLWDS